MDKWVECIESNLILPFEMLQSVWQDRKRNSAVCFLAGSNPQKIMDGYSAYNISKMALLKMVEQVDHESPDSKLFALGPGYIETKIHEATKQAQWPNAVIDSGRKGGEMSSVYEALMWCLQQPKEIVGGRNICVSDPMSNELAARLALNPSLYKLRRTE
jgi:NAD(P)-dependent dehydrogenase (short-subunit alcohol dehydrogenase family)